MPLLDYTVVRRRYNAASQNFFEREERFNPRNAFLDAFEKWPKIFKYSRKKAFKFSDLVEFLKKSKVSELEQKKAHAKELLSMIQP